MMISRNYLLQCCALLLISLRSQAITNKNDQRNSRHIGLPPPDWEVGLREATFQALLREGITDPNLKDRIFHAPLLGRQESSTPFGDIIVLARGQIYNTQNGVTFVQDPYQNDCDECHSKYNRCGKHQCDIWQPRTQQHIIGLWSVKKIRHRTLHGHKFEIEYIISPISDEKNRNFISSNGRFDYTIPGHVFVVKNAPELFAYHNHNDVSDVVYNNQATQQHQAVIFNYPGQGGHNHKDIKPVLIGYSPSGQKYVIHNYPEYFSPHPHPYPTTKIPITNDPKEIELYKQLIESLAAKTSTSTSHGPHRFDLSHGIPPKQTIATIPVYSTKPTNFIPLQTTLVQLATGHIIPMTDLSTTYPVTTTNFPTSHAPIPSTRPNIPPTKPTHFVASEPHVTYSEPDTYLNTIKPPHQIIQTTFFIPDTETPATQTSTTAKTKKPTTYATTTAKQSTPLIGDYDDFQSSLFPDTTSTTKQRKPTVVTTEKYNEETDFNSQLFPESTTSAEKQTSTQTTIEQKKTSATLSFVSTYPTEPQRPVTQAQAARPKPYPDSINEQLPPPKQDVDTTIPYVASTVTQKTIAQFEETKPKHTTARSVVPSNTTTQDILTSQMSSTTETLPKTTTEANTVAEESTTSLSTTRYYLPPKISQTETTQAEKTTHTTKRPLQTSTIYYTTELESTNQPSTLSQDTQTPEYLLGHFDTDGTTSFIQTTNIPATTLTYLGTTAQDLTTPIRTVIPPYKTTKMKTTTEVSDFLLPDGTDEKEHSNLEPQYNHQEISNDDIFGSTHFVAKATEPSTKKYTASHLENDLFGGITKDNPTNPTQQTPKIIYSDFFEASTKPPIFEYDEDEPFEATVYQIEPTPQTTTKERPLTSQSYSTSISFEVNKKHEQEPTMMAKLTEVDNGSEYKVYKAELPETTTPLTTKTIKNEFDTIALQLVNHARSIDYLNKNKKPKFKRRRYTPRKKRTEKKKRR